MKTWLNKTYNKYMIRIIVQKTVTQFLVALAFCLAWGHFMFDPNRPVTGLYTYPAAAFFFAAFAWFGWLRLDDFGRLPFFRKKKPIAAKHPIKSMGDFLNEPLRETDGLSDTEKGICQITTRLICCLAFCIMYIVQYAISGV